MTLLERTKELLVKATSGGTGKSLRQIAADSDGEVAYDWLKRFANGEIEDPSVNRIQALHDNLVATKTAKRA